MSILQLYLKLGISHITDFQGYDHILFLVTLSAVYTFKQWKGILVLITAFTIGHCTTLILATFNLLSIKSEIIEFLIPITILITSLVNIVQKDDKTSNKLQIIKYTSALFFGLIHGLGFSNYLKSLLGAESSIIKPLFAFNLGIELGQIFIVLVILSISAIFSMILQTKKRAWNLTLSGVGFGISLILIIQRFPF